MGVKHCKTCDTTKKLSEFPKHKGHSDGLGSNCKECCKQKSKAYKKANPDKAKIAVDKCWNKNRDKYNEKKKEYSKKYSKEAVARAKKWNEANPEKIIKCRKNWKANNTDKVNANTAKRRAVKLQATPKWLSEDDYKTMEQMYKMAQRETIRTGTKFHVDHIIPLKGKNVCGLHCPSNLQVIPAEENCKKSNKFEGAA